MNTNDTTLINRIAELKQEIKDWNDEINDITTIRELVRWIDTNYLQIEYYLSLDELGKRLNLKTWKEFMNWVNTLKNPDDLCKYLIEHHYEYYDYIVIFDNKFYDDDNLNELKELLFYK